MSAVRTQLVRALDARHKRIYHLVGVAGYCGRVRHCSVAGLHVWGVYEFSQAKVRDRILLSVQGRDTLCIASVRV